jgi:hypothetical protein
MEKLRDRTTKLTMEKKSLVVTLRIVPSTMTAISTPPELDWRMLSRFRAGATTRLVDSPADVESIMTTNPYVSMSL